LETKKSTIFNKKIGKIEKKLTKNDKKSKNYFLPKNIFLRLSI